MDELRAKCPWDKEQTTESIRHLTIEETYELVDAITEGSPPALKEELGDLLLHIVFYAKIASEKSQFDINDVINGICEKLIARHPHIYGDVKVANEEDVKRNWEKLKMKEGKRSVLGGVPSSLPALVKAMRLQEKSKQVGFEWENAGQVWEKVEEEANELKAEVNAMDAGKGSVEKMEEEMGDLLFSMVNYARFLNIDPDQALARTNKKFIKRFQAMEEVVAAKGKQMTDLNLAEMDAIWNTVKLSERG